MARSEFAIISPWAELYGGAERMLWNFLQQAGELASSLRVVFLEDGSLVSRTAELGIRTSVVPSGRLRRPDAVLRTIWAIKQELRGDDIGLVLNWMTKAQLYGAPAAALAGLGGRVVWWQHGMPTGGWMDRIATALPARAVGCSSAASANAQVGLRPRRATFVVNPGVQAPQRFHEERVQSLRASLGIEPNVPVVGVVGRLQPAKGQHRFIEAMDLLRLQGCEAHALIVGGEVAGRSAGYARELASLVSDRGIGRRVSTTGHVSDVGPYLALMDIFVSPSQDESFGIALVEAMLAGLPVVSAECGGPSEILQNGISGLLVADPSPKLIASAISDLLSDPALAKRISENGRQRARDRYSVERMRDDMARHLTELAAQ